MGYGPPMGPPGLMGPPPGMGPPGPYPPSLLMGPPGPYGLGGENATVMKNGLFNTEVFNLDKYQLNSLWLDICLIYVIVLTFQDHHHQGCMVGHQVCEVHLRLTEAL